MPAYMSILSTKAIPVFAALQKRVITQNPTPYHAGRLYGFQAEPYALLETTPMPASTSSRSHHIMKDGRFLRKHGYILHSIPFPTTDRPFWSSIWSLYVMMISGVHPSDVAPFTSLFILMISGFSLYLSQSRYTTLISALMSFF